MNKLENVNGQRYPLNIKCGMRTIYFKGLNKNLSSKFWWSYWIQQTPEEDWRVPKWIYLDNCKDIISEINYLGQCKNQ